MKGLTFMLAMTAVLALGVVAEAVEYDTHCGRNGGFRSRTAQTGGCGVSQTRQMQSPPRFQGDDVVSSPEPTNRTAGTRRTRFVIHTVGKPTIHCDGKVVEPPVVLVPMIRARVYVPMRARVYVPIGTSPVVGVPTSKGYFYRERRLGILGLGGREIQYHEYGGK